MVFFDSHTHIHFKGFEEDREEVIHRAQEAGVLMVTVGTQIDTSRHGLEVAEAHEGVWATVGLHPNHTTEQTFSDPNESEELAVVKTRTEIFDVEAYRPLALHPKCVGIGECGFDFYRIPEHLNREEVIATQEVMLRRQFDLATEVGKPVVIHCRDAYGPQADLIAEYVSAGKLPARGVMHCFSGTEKEAERFLELGFYISFSGVVTFSPRKGEGENALWQVVKKVPLDRLMIETDAPYLAPMPMRGKRNEPLFVKYTAEFIAKLRGVSVEAIAEATTQNAMRVFRIE